jgi:methylthioribose-1-phosphate isomerase
LKIEKFASRLIGLELRILFHVFLAILAKHFKISFYIAAPMTTIDYECKSGSEIVVEERSHSEISHFKGQQVAAEGIGIWNPAFDIAPAELITKIITDKGTVSPHNVQSLL